MKIYETDQYDTKFGTVQVKFKYEHNVSLTQSISALITDIKPIDIPLETSAANQEMRYASTKIIFRKDDSIGTVLDNIKIDEKENETFVEVYVDGSIYWKGLLDFQNVEKKKYYVDDTSNLDYIELTLPVLDAMAYFDRNSVTLSDLGYSTENSEPLKTLIETIFTEIGFGSPSIDTNLSIEEANGTTYDLSNTDLHYYIEDAGILVMTFLKRFMFDLGYFIYNLNDNYHLISRTGGVTNGVSNSDINDIKKVSNDNIIHYVRIGAEYKLKNVNYHDPSTFFEEEKRGNPSGNDENNFIYSASNVLGNIFTSESAGMLIGTGVYIPTSYVTGDTRGPIHIEDTSQDYITTGVETGDLIFFEDSTAPLGYRRSIVTKVEATKIYFHDLNIDTSLLDYAISRGDEGDRYKTYLLLDSVADI